MIAISAFAEPDITEPVAFSLPVVGPVPTFDEAINDVCDSSTSEIPSEDTPAEDDADVWA